MVELSERGPFDGVDLPLEAGGVRLVATPWRQMTSISPFAGAKADVDAALRAALGVGLPSAGLSARADAVECRWFGAEQWLLIGAEPPELSAALTDQSDGWAGLMLEGAHVAEVLARLCPLDLSPEVFGPGATARTLLRHIPLSLTRQDGFHLMVPRSYAEDAYGEIVHAMRSVAAQGVAG